MGGNPFTFSGLTGMGDLIVTCTSVHSRNWRAGNMLGQGMKLQEVLDQMGMVVEGVPALCVHTSVSCPFSASTIASAVPHEPAPNTQTFSITKSSLCWVVY